MTSIVDAQQRLQALDPTGSYIVQAPAGSGKTELLIQRYMLLLSRVQRPDEVLALTFTRKAAAEMRHRVMDALLEAAHQPEPADGHRRQTWIIACQALENDQKRGWNLLHNPTQLRIQTLDSFNGGLVRRMPWLSRLGGMPPLSENSRPLYLEAAEKLFLQASTHSQLNEATTCLLAHLDNRLDHLVEMVADLLGKRDQWLGYLASGTADRTELEKAIAGLTEQRMAQIDACLTVSHKDRLVRLIGYADGCLRTESKPGYPGWDAGAFPHPVAAEITPWRELCRCLLKADGSLRKTVTKANGFPAGKGAAKETKQAMADLLEQLQTVPGLEAALKGFSLSAATSYDDAQWEVLQALFDLLPLAVLQLWGVFRGRGEVDFAELALKAQEALHSGDNPTDLLQQLDQQLSHILVDEFQDTSHLQYRLLDSLTEGWTPTDGRTLFVVGDPMQSIYRFREAEVGLFLQAWKGRLGSVQLTPIQLVSNFRSQGDIVAWNNHAFAKAFPSQVNPLAGAVPFAASTAVKLSEPMAVQFYPQAEKDEAAEAELVAERVNSLCAQGNDTVAILVRSRTHLPAILKALRSYEVPYQAQEIEVLSDRQIVIDLHALVCALSHPADDLSWLALLRSPVCGLDVSDLLHLSQGRAGQLYADLDADQLSSSLSDDGFKRIMRVLPMLRAAWQRRGRLPLRRLIEGVWLRIGGPACYSETDLADAQVFFDLIERLDEGGELPSFQRLDEELKRLFSAPDPAAGTQVQVMTIHKAKGLEFDHVLLPGLGRLPQKDSNPLLRWLYDPDFKLLLAPVAPKDGLAQKDPVYESIRQVEQKRSEHELSRLLYVACTRAVKQLFLFGHATRKQDGYVPAKDSFLSLLWPAVHNHFDSLTEQDRLEETDVTPRLQRLKRLPVDWALPEIGSSPVPCGSLTITASDRSEDELLLFSGFETDVARHVGNEVHRLLERFALEGVSSWSMDKLEQERRSLTFRLSSSGVPLKQIDPAIERIIKAAARTLNSETGRWVLASHQDHRCEQPLTGVLDGKALHTVIDRTFIDGGERWIIDYKTSEPDGDVDRFLRHEEERYRSQIGAYRDLYRRMEPDRKTRCALYFPMIDLCHELHLDE